MDRKVFCWGNPVIKVQLREGLISREVPDKRLRKKFLTARGLSDWLLFKSVEPGVTDPLSPDNVMLIGSGILVGTVFPGAVRTNVVSLNALTGGYGESSAAGTFSNELKKAGYDGIALRGKSTVPVYLWVHDGRAEIRDAAHLCGMTTFETDRAIKEELEDRRITTLSVGPAGENLVRFACINVTNRYCGRCGMGAVMGSKNLKAIAARGTRPIITSDPDKIRRISKKVRELLRRDQRTRSIAERGMAAQDGFKESGHVGIKNFQSVYFDRARRRGYNAVRKYYRKTIHHRGCPVDCDRVVEIPKGEPYGGTTVSSMEATPAWNFAHFLVDHLNSVIKGFELCNAYGLDVHSWSNVMQWAIECYERGILTKCETDGLDLRWGDGILLLESIGKIAKREGRFGSLLADGVARASKKIGRGSEKYAMHMKGMEIDDELRINKGNALGVMTELRGPGHVLGSWWGETNKDLTPYEARKLYGTEYAARPMDYDDKADLVFSTERYAAIQDCLGICAFSTHRTASRIYSEYNMRTYVELMEAATSWKTSEEELFQIADRILALEKSINILAGLERADDVPPDRFFEPIPDGHFKGISLDKTKVVELLRRHDELHGWDPETGTPTRETLESLDLKEVADKLESAGKLK